MGLSLQSFSALKRSGCDDAWGVIGTWLDGDGAGCGEDAEDEVATARADTDGSDVA